MVLYCQTGSIINTTSKQPLVHYYYMNNVNNNNSSILYFSKAPYAENRIINFLAHMLELVF